MLDIKGMNREDFIHEQVMKIVKENMEFNNVAREKATKASASATSTGEIVKDSKPSSSTQGSWDSTDTPGGVSSIAKSKWNVQEIAAMVTKVLVQNGVEFSNKPLPEPTTISASTQPAWKAEPEEEPKPSAATQGAWDTTDTPGGVSTEAKNAWNVSEIAAMVTKVLRNTTEFSNKPLPEPTTISASTQPAWKTGEEEEPKMSASTQAVWKKDEPRKPSASTQAGWK